MSKLLAIYINLESSIARRNSMEAQLKGHSLNHERFEGIKGNEIEDLKEYLDLEHFSRCHGRECRAGEVGCYFSHLGAIQKFLDSDHMFGLILEDDAMISANAVALINKLMTPETSTLWDFAKLQSRRQTILKPVHKIDEAHSLAIPFSRSTGATAYLINRKAAERMLSELSKMEVPWDHAFDRPGFLKIKYRAVTPFPIELEDELQSQSNIETSKPLKRKGLRKIPTLLWRARSEISRAVWAITTYSKIKLFRKP